MLHMTINPDRFLEDLDRLKKEKGINNLWKEEQYKEWREEVKKHPEKVGKLHITEDSFTFNFNDKNETIEGEIYISIDDVLLNSKELNQSFDDEFRAKYYENKKRGELRRAKHYINEKSKYYVPFPTSKQIKNYKLGQSIGFSGEEDVMKGSVIDKDDLATGGIASLLK